MPLEKEIENIEKENNNHAQTKKGFFNRIKSSAKVSLSILAIAATVACGNGYKKIYDTDYATVYINEDGSKLKMELNMGTFIKDKFYFEGPALSELRLLDADNLQLVKYERDKLGPLNRTVYDNEMNIVDHAKLQIKEEQGREILRQHRKQMASYMVNK